MKYSFKVIVVGGRKAVSVRILSFMVGLVIQPRKDALTVCGRKRGRGGFRGGFCLYCYRLCCDT